MLAKGAGLAKDVRTDIAALHAAGPGFVQPRLTERDVLAARSERALNEATASLDAIDAVPGQLTTRDEAMLREPLLGVRIAGAALMSRAGSQSAQKLARYSESFSARLADVTVPEGTRTSLATKLAAYEHTALSVRHDEDPRREAERPVALPTGDAVRALTAER